jgi:hypothetical protein
MGTRCAALPARSPRRSASIFRRSDERYGKSAVRRALTSHLPIGAQSSRMILPIPLAAQSVGQLLHRAAELRAMAKTARIADVMASLIRVAERIEAIAAARVIPRDD